MLNMSCRRTWKPVPSSQKATTAQTAAQERIASAFNWAVFCYEAFSFSFSFIDSPTFCLLLSFQRHPLHTKGETQGEVKSGAGMEFCSIYPPPPLPEIFFSIWHTLFSLCPHSPLCSSLLLSISLLISVWHVVISLHSKWLSGALKYWSSLSITSCSITGSLCSSVPFPKL